MMNKNNRAQKKPVEGSKFFRWVGHPLAVFGLAVGLLCGSCRTIYVPVETDTSVSVKDSTAIHYIDSIRITEATRYTFQRHAALVLNPNVIPVKCTISMSAA